LKGLFGVIGMDFYPNSLLARKFATEPKDRRGGGDPVGFGSRQHRARGRRKRGAAGGGDSSPREGGGAGLDHFPISPFERSGLAFGFGHRRFACANLIFDLLVPEYRERSRRVWMGGSSAEIEVELRTRAGAPAGSRARRPPRQFAKPRPVPATSTPEPPTSVSPQHAFDTTAASSSLATYKRDKIAAVLFWG
jgi:hypothetical protein